MLLIKTKLKESSIHGIGLFADEFIPKGTKIWKFMPGFDLAFTPRELQKFPETARKFIHWYGYRSLHSGRYILCADDARFYNHHEIPNTIGIDLEGTEEEGADIAVRDIQKGEEITYNYKDPKEGDADWKIKLSR